MRNQSFNHTWYVSKDGNQNTRIDQDAFNY